MKASLTLMLLLLSVSSPCWAKAPIVVVAGKGSRVEALTPDQVKDIFLGKDALLPGGERAVVADQADAASIKAEFYDAVASMSLKEVARHWAKIIFTGRGTPPEKLDGDQNVKAWVAAKTNRVGYIYASSVDDGVKVLLRLSP